MKLIPTGGVNLENAAAFIRAGASAIAVGGNLVDAPTVRNEEWATCWKSALVSFPKW